MKSEVYMVVTAKNTVFYNVTLCSVVKVYGRFRDAFCCYYQGWRISYSRHSSTLVKEAAGSLNNMPSHLRRHQSSVLTTSKQPFVYQVYATGLTLSCSEAATTMPKGIYCTVWKIFTVHSDRDTTNSRHQCPPGEDTGHSAKKFLLPPPPFNPQSH